MIDTCQQLQNRGGWAEDLALGRCHNPIGPRNTYSNLSFLVVGVAVHLYLRTPASFLFALAMFALCYGSWRYHAEKTRRANLLDRVGMFLVLVQLAVHGVWRLFHLPSAPLPALVIVTLLLTVAAVYYAPLKWMDAQIGAWVALATLGGIVGGRPWLAGLAFALFVAAYACWQLDKDPRRPLGLWGHAIWHLVAGPAFGVLFLAVVG